MSENVIRHEPIEVKGCIVCGEETVGISKAEFGEDGNWHEGPLCSTHYERAEKYGRVAGRVNRFRVYNDEQCVECTE